MAPSQDSTLTPEAEPAVTVRQSTDVDAAIVSVPITGVDLEAVERALIVFALDTTDGNRTRAAKLLRLTRSALLYRLQKFGLTSQQGRS
ncbi:MAG: helix-turn-helix domain-containing protein [Cyanobacteria bacterium]|nr:helix-turn-helix domain-containing protein [Cyanobacteriota bacterium]